MKKRYIIITAVLLIIGGGAFFLVRKGQTVSVKKVHIQQAVVQKTISGSGEIKSKSEANLAFASGGRVTALYAQKGDTVRKGQIIGQLDAYTQSQTAQAAKDTRDIAIRNRDLFREQMNGDTEDNRIKLRTYDEEVSKAEATYQASVGTLKNQIIRAPFAGTVVARTKEVGEIAGASETVYTVADLSQLYFEVELDQEDFGPIKLGQKGIIDLDAHTDTQFTSTVSELPKYAEKDSSGNQTFIVKLSVEPQADHPLLLGMTGDARIVVAETNGAVSAVDFDVITMDDRNAPAVWTVDTQQKLKKEPVQIGLEGDITTELKTDLSQKTVVVSTNSKTELKEGARVKVVE